MRPALPLLLPFALLAIPAARALPADGVTIYRCTDAAGKVALRDSPCAKGQQQQVRSMIRPKDAPRVAAPRRSPAPTPAPAERTRVVVVNAPRPLYECVTPDNDSYTSETPEGNPRWVPLWTLGYPVLAQGPVYQPGGGYVRYRDGRVSGEWRTGSVGYGTYPTAAAYGAGSWVRDACHALPQAEVCSRLVDRRDELRRRFFNAMPSERERLSVEERGINARLASDCS